MNLGCQALVRKIEARGLTMRSSRIASLRRPHGRKSLPCGQLRAAIRLNLSVSFLTHER